MSAREIPGLSGVSGRIGAAPGVLSTLDRGLTQPNQASDWRAVMDSTHGIRIDKRFIRRNTIESFWAQVAPGGFCWYWQGAVTHEGYGYMWLDGTNRAAHRIAYEALVGTIPSGLQIDHLCRTRNCVNPDHLEPVTPTVNSERANRPKVERTHCMHGHEWTHENTLPLGISKRCRQCVLVRTHQKRGIPCTYKSLCSMPGHSAAATNCKCHEGSEDES